MKTSLDASHAWHSHRAWIRSFDVRQLAAALKAGDARTSWGGAPEMVMIAKPLQWRGKAPTFQTRGERFGLGDGGAAPINRGAASCLNCGRTLYCTPYDVLAGLEGFVHGVRNETTR